MIDAGGKAALPGFVDLHYHTAIGKGYCDHLDLWEILQAFWYPMIRSINTEEAYWAAMASYSESLKAGVTTANDMFRRLSGPGSRCGRQRDSGGAIQRGGGSGARHRCS